MGGHFRAARRQGARPSRPAANGGDSLAGLRDGALLRVMSDGLLRISEAAALQVADVEATADGGTVTIRASKTDQQGTALCGSSALPPWRPCAATSMPPASPTVPCSGGSARATRSPPTVWAPTRSGAIVRKRAAAVDGITGRIGGYSLRVGSARELAADGASLVELQQAGGWRSPTTPAVYVRRESDTRGPVARRRYGVGQ